MSLLVPKRVVEEELLDEHDAPYPEMARSLRDLRRINRYTGGSRVYVRLLQRFFDGAVPRGTTLLDLGTGTSDPLDAAQQCYATRGFGLDFKIDHLLYNRAVAPQSQVVRIAGNAFQLPLRDDSIDVVTSALFFHHFEPEENLQILRESLRVARRGVVVNDTLRHRAPLLFIQLLGALRLVGPITAFDGPASVRRAYTLPEASSVAQQLGVARVEMVSIIPFRFGMLLWKST